MASKESHSWVKQGLQTQWIELSQSQVQGLPEENSAGRGWQRGCALPETEPSTMVGSQGGQGLLKPLTSPSFEGLFIPI